MNDRSINLLKFCCLTSPLVFFSFSACAAEWSIEPQLKAQVEYNDNIFLTSAPHDGVSALKITPSVDAVVSEQNWQANLNARITNNNYSDHTLNSNDEFYTLTGQYRGERNIFSLSGNYTLDSNLSAVSSNFGVFGLRVNREIKGVSPRYTRLLTERSSLTLSYSYQDVDYSEDATARYTAYRLQSLSGSYIYDLTENDQLTLSLDATKYKSKDERTEYTLLSPRVGIAHDFSGTLSADFSAGTSRQKTTNRLIRVINFFNTPILVTEVTDSTNRGFVLDAGVEKTFETSSVEGRVKRTDSTDSFGNLNTVDTFSITYQHSLSERWRYNTHLRYEDIAAVSRGSGLNNTSIDRQIYFFDTIVSYRLSKDWTTNFSYRYIQRRFRSDTSTDRAPHSNLVYVGMTYNFPAFTTF